MKIAYICDGLCACSGKVGCFRTGLPGMDYCRHTFDERHAINGMCKYPENHPERFNRIDITDSESCWWEGPVWGTEPNDTWGEDGKEK